MTLRTTPKEDVVTDRAFDPGAWTGDAEELRDVVELLLEDRDGAVCEPLFASKHEAFLNGFLLGREREQEGREEIGQLPD